MNKRQDDQISERVERCDSCNSSPDVVMIWTRPRPCQTDLVPTATPAVQYLRPELADESIDEIWFRPLTEDQAAELLGLSGSTLRVWRRNRPGYGPQHLQFGTSVRYRRQDLRDWMESRLAIGVRPDTPIAGGGRNGEEQAVTAEVRPEPRMRRARVTTDMLLGK